MARQREIVQQWADQHGHDIVGWAEDLDVSGSVDPFDTPALGPWLDHRAPEWDILAAWKLDRLGRNAIQLNKLFGWCGEHGKTLVSCSENIDLGNWSGRMMASVIAGLEEGELEAIRERVTASKRKLREEARWGGGKPPFGYVSVPRAGGGRVLEIDNASHGVIRKIVDDVLAGKPMTRLADELNTEGYLTPVQYHETLGQMNRPTRLPFAELPVDDNGIRKPKWTANTLKNMLRNKSLRGHVHYKGETVRDDDGMPVEIAPPLVTTDEWELLQARLDRTQAARTTRPSSTSPLSGLVVCYACGGPLYHEHNSVKRDETVYEYRYYRCRDRCSSMIPADYLEELAEDAFLLELGDVEVRERVWVQGDSREADLREAVAGVDELAKAIGRAKSETTRQRLQRQIDALDARIAELESAPSQSARWEYRPTGTTYGAVWKSATNPDERRELLLRSGITIAARKEGGDRRYRNSGGSFYCDIRVPAEIRERFDGATGPSNGIRSNGEQRAHRER